MLAALRWDAQAHSQAWHLASLLSVGAQCAQSQVLAFAAPALLENRSFALRAVACDGRSLESLAAGNEGKMRT